MYVCMYVCIYVSMYVSMYLCMYVCMYVKVCLVYIAAIRPTQGHLVRPRKAHQLTFYWDYIIYLQEKIDTLRLFYR